MDTYRKLLDLFDARERWRLAGVFAAVLGTGLLEVVGVASIMPFMALVSNPDAALQNPWVRGLYDGLGFGSRQSFLVASGAAVLVLMTFTNAFSAFSTWIILRFSWRKHHAVSERLLRGYLYQPYSYFLSHNTANLSKNILTEAQTVVEGVLVPAMTLLARLITAALVLGLLLVVNVGLALTIMAVLGGAYAAIYLAYRGRTQHMGRERTEANAARYKAAAEALGGIKDVKVLGREEEFMRRFSAPSLSFSMTVARGLAMAQLPRYALDSLAFGGILLIVLYMLVVRGDAAQVIPIVSLYAVAGYRLLPTLQAAFHALARIRFSAPALDELHRDLFGGAAVAPPVPASAAAAEAPPPPPLPFAREIAVHDLAFRYEGTASRVLKGVSLAVPRNQSVALVGSTGSGKTTLVDIVLGLLEPEEGRITVDGVPVTDANRAGWKRMLGYVPQQIFLSDDTIARNIAFGVPEGRVDRAAVERAARIAHLHDFVCELPEGYETVVGERGVRLSGGQRQRIGIARALYHDPEVLILDEATSALDGITEDAVMQAIQELAHRKTIVLIAHRLRTVRHCDAIYLLERGRVAARGTYDELMETSAQFRSMAAGRPDAALLPG
ncbi:MAG TPA: ABC transporter ATP-binding protein/permease [Longimicrobium sp.]|nr:ABC transporter ATP-binding protein/permease [Longimicrobium sp.]